MLKVEEFLYRCIKYNNFTNAIHAAQVLALKGEEKSYLLLGYLYLRNREYRRALQHLSMARGYTSLFYQALCFYHLKEYHSAKTALGKLLKSQESGQETPRTALEHLYYLERDQAQVLEMLGELNILTGCYEMAIDSYHKASIKDPLCYTAHKMVLADTLTEISQDETEEENRINGFSQIPKRSAAKVVQDLDLRIFQRLQAQGTLDSGAAAVLRSLLLETEILQKVSKDDFSMVCSKETLRELPITTAGHAAVHLFEAGYMQRAAVVFEYIKSRDPGCLDYMQYYSSIFWHQRDRSMLGSLARDFFGVNPHSNIAWATLGNYFSLRKETDRAIKCFERSTAIKKDAYTLCLLGHEHFMNSNLTESLRCFLSSIQMRAKHYSGIAGCGLIYEKIGRKENAEYCFMKANRCKPQNVLLGYLAVKFLLSQNRYPKAYSLLQKYLGIKQNLQELSEGILRNEWYSSIQAAAQKNEQVPALLGLFLLEVSHILAQAGHVQSAEIVASEAEGEGPAFAARKAHLLETILGLNEKSK